MNSTSTVHRSGLVPKGWTRCAGMTLEQFTLREQETLGTDTLSIYEAIPTYVIPAKAGTP